MPTNHSALHPFWIAIRVRTRYETAVARMLENKGYELFLPMRSVCKQWSDRSKKVLYPLFPGYVFCRLDSASCGPIVTTPGVIYILKTGDTMASIPQEEIAALQLIAHTKAPAEPYPYLAAGDRVQIESGPLTGVRGILLDRGNGVRLVISVSLIQNSISVEVDRCNVAPLAVSYAS